MGRTAIVVGAGIGGLSTARALERTGWDVAVYDQAPAFGPVGAGIGIAPNAVKALEWLGLATHLRAQGVRQEGMQIRLASGRRVAHLPATDIEARFDDPFIALHRAELHQILLDSLENVAQYTGHRVTGATIDTGRPSVSFETTTGPLTVSADLVVAADGVHSQLRGSVFPAYPGPTYAGYTVWRGIVPAHQAAHLGIDPILTETWGRAARFGIAVINDGQVYWFACENMPEGATPRHSLNDVAARFRDWHAPIPQLLAATPPESLLRHDVYYLKASLPAFVRDRVVLVGDAAHAVTPDIGQGACLAIEDAVVLADALHRTGIDEALATYDVARRPRTQQLARTSGTLGRILQTGNPAATLLRDTIARALPTPLLARFASGAFAWTPPEPIAGEPTHPHG
ncbi:FAD-dependent monooxygenase [Micromonospora sp. CPCC 206061]|uniref:FAD-dependent monooxygenase n=1 Tax=Micromonospora sp. CPCC 206061 TaxID=3122410 RepID=UPI002FF11FA8